MKPSLCVLVSFLLLNACNPGQKEQEKRPQVSAIYPSSDTLPENLLRMYIQFSSPMKTVGNLEKIRLLDERGAEVKGAIFNNVYELWNQEQNQLTLIFDPARVKKGLQVHEELGHAIKAGNSYQVVLSGLEDIYHQPLNRTFVKSFVVTQKDTFPPNTETWKIIAPKSHSLTPVKVIFPDMLDVISLRDRLMLTTMEGLEVTGKVSIGYAEKCWEFAPHVRWEPGRYILLVHSRLEDPAGNNLNGLFDHPVGSLKQTSEDQIQRIVFEIR